MESEKLLPCPFCGGEPQSKTVAIPDGQTLSCRNLKCMAGVAAFNPDAAAKCIAAWNTRAPADLRSALEAEAPALSDDDLDQHLPENVRGAKRCGIQRSDWLTGWYVPWSPRNDNQNAEGPWSDWVALAHAILAKDAEARAALAPTKGDVS